MTIRATRHGPVISDISTPPGAVPAGEILALQATFLAGEDRTLLIERKGRSGERHEIKIDDAILAAGFYDLANANVSLLRGAIYVARIGRHAMTFQVDANAKSSPAPVVSRLLRFQ